MNRTFSCFPRAPRLASTLAFAVCGIAFSGHFAAAQSGAAQSGAAQSGQSSPMLSGQPSSMRPGAMQSGQSSGSMQSGLAPSGLARPGAAQSGSAHSGSSHPGTATSGAVNGMGSSGATSGSQGSPMSGQSSFQGAPANDMRNGISGNVPDAGAADTTYGVNSPGRLIGPSPENGEPDPRFPNERDTSSGGGSEINGLSASAGNAQAPVASLGDKSKPGGNPQGGTTSNLNEGLPSASKDNSGGNAGTGIGGPGGGPGNLGSDARPDASASQSTQNPSDVGRETAGAAPYALGAGAVIIGAFLFSVLHQRAKKRR